MTPTDEQKRQWRRAMQYLPLSLVRDMADAFRDALAEVRRLEYEAHGSHYRGCVDCPAWNPDDPRHAYTDEDWKQDAEKELSE